MHKNVDEQKIYCLIYPFAFPIFLGENNAAFKIFKLTE